MISHRHRCIYVKVPKCASTAVQAWFIAHGGGRSSYPPYWYPGPLPQRLAWTARALELYPSYDAFTFVRDPLARFLSLYRNAVRVAARRAADTPQRPASLGSPAEFAVLCGELLAETRRLWGREANAFLRDNATRRYGPLGLQLRHLTFAFNHLRPQVDFLPDCNPDRLFGIRRANAAPLGFVGRMETIAADFARLQERLDLPREPLPRLNASRGGPAPRCDAATERLVGELYAEDAAFIAALPRPGSSPPAISRSAACRNATSRNGAAASARPGVRTLLPRALFNAFTMEIGLEARLHGSPALRPLLAPFARLRRGSG